MLDLCEKKCPKLGEFRRNVNEEDSITNARIGVFPICDVRYAVNPYQEMGVYIEREVEKDGLQ